MQHVLADSDNVASNTAQYLFNFGLTSSRFTSTSAGVYYKTFSSLKQEPKLSALKVPLARASRE